MKTYGQNSFKLLYVGTEFFRSSGGIQYVNRALARVFCDFADKTPAQIEVFSLNDRADDFDSRVIRPDICAWHAFGGDRFAMTRALGAALLRVRPHVALFTHIHLLRLAPLLRALSSQTKFTLLTHGVEVWQPLPRMLQRALQNCRAVVAPSRFTREKLIAVQGVAESRISVLAHGLDSDWSGMPRIAFHSKMNSPVVLCVSRMNRADREKGVEILLRAMPWVRRDVPTAHLQIVGDGDDRPRLESLARELRIAESVQFLGEVRHAALRDAYASARVFCLPSSKEGFGIVFLEAMIHGLPVVAARAGGTTDVVEDGVTGILVPPEDPSSLGSALSGLLLMPEECQKLGAAGRRRVEDNFLYAHFAARWHRWLADIAPDAVHVARDSAAFAPSKSAI